MRTEHQLCLAHQPTLDHSMSTKLVLNLLFQVMISQMRIYTLSHWIAIISTQLLRQLEHTLQRQRLVLWMLIPIHSVKIQLSQHSHKIWLEHTQSHVLPLIHILEALTKYLL